MCRAPVSRTVTAAVAHASNDMANPQRRLPCSTLAAAVAAILLVSAAASDFASIGAAIASSAGSAAANISSNVTGVNATTPNITANAGPADTQGVVMDPKQRLQLGAELRDYLLKVFKGRKDVEDRVNKAWEEEQVLARRGDPIRFQAGDFFKQDDAKVEAFSHAPGNPAVNQLYETGHPWAESRMEELVTGRGYPLERYPVVTPDGYELILFRIPYGRYRNNVPGVKKPVVFLQHGVTLASDSMTILNANESLAFIMADAGFDVWMGNTRGNTYSRRNVNGLYPYQVEFWFFSLDQLILADMSTMIDFSLRTSGASKLAYVGHSQGATLIMSLLAARPEYNNKISVAAHMGPVYFVDFFRTPFLRFAAINSLDQLLLVLGGIVGIGEFIPNRLTAPLILTLCTAWPLDEVCVAAISFFTFGPSIFITPDDYISIATTWPSSVGIRNLAHWAQMFRTPELEFRQYDFGTVCNRTTYRPGHGFQPTPFFETCNQQVYGSITPPAYNLAQATAPQYMFLGENDLLSVASDVEEEVRRLGNAHKGDFIYSDYSHMDFVWDRNSKHSVDLVDIFYRYSAGTF